MSPEIFEGLFNKIDVSNFLNKLDTFSIGLIVIQIGLQRGLDSLYDTKEGFFNRNYLN